MPKKNTHKRNQKRKQRVPKRIVDPSEHITTIMITDDIRMLASGGTSLATSISVNPASTSTDVFNALKAAFRFYRVNWVAAMLTPVSTSTGATMFYWNNQDLSAPTAGAAIGAVGTALDNNVASAKVVRFKGLSWTGYYMYCPFTKSEDTTSADFYQWTSTTVAGAAMQFKAYTDSSNFGSPISTQLWCCRFVYSVSFKTQNS